MSHDQQFEYTIFIRATPELLWRALTEPNWTTRWWKVAFHSDWQVGSTLDVEQSGVVISDPEQLILEATKFRRLAYTWHTFTPEWAAVHGFSDEFLAAVAAEPRSRVSFDLEFHNEVTKLHVCHEGFGPQSTVLLSVREGWPPLLSSLKSLLETGDPLPT